MTHLSLRERARLRFHGDRAPSLEELIAQPKTVEIPAKQPKTPRAPRPLIMGPIDAPVKELPKLECLDCGKPLIGNWRGAYPKRCDVCRPIHDRKLRVAREKARPPRDRVDYDPIRCAICGDTFKPRYRNSVCCGDACNQELKIKRKREARARARNMGVKNPS